MFSESGAVKLKKFGAFYLAAIFIISCFILGLSSEKTFAESGIRYWICGTCGMKTKSLKGYVPEREVRSIRDYIPSLIHIHDWQEVDEETYYKW